jgi:hypothetical protein
MRKTALFAVTAAALIATGFGVWAASPTNARVPSSQGIESFKIMLNTKSLPAQEFADYTFVFSH